MGEVGFVEVAPCYLSVGRWTEITIDTGAAQSTLRDIKLPETAGGYAYLNSSYLGSATRNRFIYWRTTNDILELSEVCLDVDLLGNQLRLRFQNTPILEGISINEMVDQVVILVSTVASLHRLVFPHPEKMNPSSNYGSLQSVEKTRKSIFFDASAGSFCNPLHYYLLSHNSMGMVLPHTSCSRVASNGDSVFVLANNAGSLLVFSMPSAHRGGPVSVTELRDSSVMGRLWSGLVPSVIRGSQENEEIPLSLVSHMINHDVLIFALCRDLRIKLWSYEKKQCLMSVSVLEQLGNGKNTTSWNVTGRQPCLRKAVDTESSEVFLGVFWGVPEHRQFCVFRPVISAGQYQLSHVATLFSSESNLIDFCLTSSQIWTLWLDENNETSVMYTSFLSLPDDQKCWKSVALDTSAFQSCHLGLGVVDPREAYMKEIFSMGKFSKSTISKAINMYKRTPPEVSLTRESPSLDILKSDVISAIENEIRQRANEAEVSDEEFQRLQLECWEIFYSYCVQYLEVGTKPLGLVIDDATGVVGVIKKNMFSLLRPCDPLEHLIFSDGSECGLKYMDVNPLVAEDPSLSRALQCILDCTHLIEDNLSEEVMPNLMRRLANLHSPETVAADIVKDDVMLAENMKNGESLNSLIKEMLQTAPQLTQAIRVLINGLDLSQGQSEVPWDTDGVDHEIIFLYNQLFNSPVSLMVISEALHQMAEFRFSFSCALLILLLVINRESEVFTELQQDDMEYIESTLIPQLNMFVQAYYFMLWATETELTLIPSSVLESGFKKLSLLESSDFHPSFRLQKSEIQPRSLVSLFIQDQGGVQARKILSGMITLEESRTQLWSSVLPPLVNTLAQLIWPINANFIFPEFLLSQCQYLHIQEYVRLLSGWCEVNSVSRQFLLAVSHLSLGEPLKAVDIACQVAEDVSQEPFLCNKLFPLCDEEVKLEDLVIAYYMKVIQMFEYYNHPDCIISLAKAAISAAPKQHPQIPTLQSILFKHHLEIGLSEEAYEAMICNPDSSRRKDCLRQFIVTLCERQEMKKLVSFPYVDMQNDVISILESRARSTDLTCHSYYDLLYSFYIHRQNYRRAGTVMYEYGMRLAREVSGLESLQEQVCCLLMTMNCLHLVDPNYAWIVKKVPAGSLQNAASSGRSPKRDAEGEEKTEDVEHKIEVLDLNNIRKEYILANARLQLSTRNPSPTNIARSPLSPDEIVALLVNAGIFDMAVTVSQAFDLSLRPVFEGLVSKCVLLSSEPEDCGPLEGREAGDTLEWIAENVMSISTPPIELSLKKQVWYLLQHFLQKYEKPRQSILHRTVAQKLFSLGVSLPAWLTASYKKKNMPELLYLFNSYDQLQDSVDLVIEYIDAVLGKGPECFNLQNTLHATSPPVWMPYTHIDELLRLLEEDISYAELRQKLLNKLDVYFREVERTSLMRKEYLAKT